MLLLADVVDLVVSTLVHFQNNPAIPNDCHWSLYLEPPNKDHRSPLETTIFLRQSSFMHVLVLMR